MLALPVCHAIYNLSWRTSHLPLRRVDMLLVGEHLHMPIRSDLVGLLCDSLHVLISVCSLLYRECSIKISNILLQLWKSHSPLLSNQWIKEITKVLWDPWREKLLRGLNKSNGVLTTRGTFPNRFSGIGRDLQLVQVLKVTRLNYDIYRKAALDICSKQVLFTEAERQQLTFSSESYYVGI